MLTIALFFVSIVSFILLIVFFNAVEKNKKGSAILVALGASVVIFALSGTLSATYVKPYVGSGEILDLREVEAHRSGSVKARSYTPKCYSVIITTTSNQSENPLRSLCVPYSQWKDLKVSETVSFGHDKERHPYWGNYVIGDNEPSRSSNGKFKQHCEFVELEKGSVDAKCDKIPESEYFKIESDKNIRKLKDPEYLKKIKEIRESRKALETTEEK